MLTPKQECFVQELIKGKSQREAYKISYPNSKTYKDKSIDELASKLFSNTKVKSRYDELNKKHQDKAIMTKDELLRGLKQGFEIALGLKPTKKLITNVIQNELAVNEIEGIEIDLKALAQISEKIAKLEGWHIDKVEHSGQMTVEINITGEEDEA